MDHDKHAMTPGGIHDGEQKIVADGEAGIGHEDLDGTYACLGQPRKLPVKIGAGFHGDDAMQPIVDDRTSGSTAQRAFERLQRCHTGTGHGEGHDAGCAAEGGGDGARLEIICGCRTAPGWLVQMAMRVDATREHPAAACVDRLPPIEITAEGRDFSVVDADIAFAPAVVQRNASAPDDQIVRHAGGSWTGVAGMSMTGGMASSRSRGRWQAIVCVSEKACTGGRMLAQVSPSE
jgi:hypothetical protein